MRTEDFRRRLPSSAAPVESGPDDTFIVFAELHQHGIGFSRVHLRRLISHKLFPPPVMLSPNRIAWRLSDVSAWKASRPVAPVEAAA
jgi:predicted DNA-binding transcriptional regulator AlpA